MKRLLLAAALSLSSAQAADLTLRFLDVGQGDAVLVTTPDGKTMLYDAGKGGKAAELLARYGVKRLDLAVASHADFDHIGGFLDVVPRFKPRVFLNNGLPSPTATYTRVLTALQQVGAQGIVASDRTLKLGNSVSLRVLPPPQSAPKNNQNANSVGLILSYGKFRAFLGGDAEPVTTRAWAKTYPELLRGIPVYKALHHGSRHNDAAEFLALIAPKVIAIGVGPNNYGHPDPQALELYRKTGAQVLRTDQNGTITITAKADGRYTVTAERGSPGRPAPTPPKPPAAPPAPAQGPLLPASPAYSGPFDPAGADRDCGDFRTRAEAQAFFLAAGGPDRDPHGLDRDGNGQACESLR
ncbi:beta-lactamase superfamily II metal-dependent hydrolase [Deinobacterium chartae]|uniref:Beta-lactamase superfamily II metal-dependent hydrolase n=1 Tax=Deinobacterium chartae TaxID=521158 RepID=A0A841I2G7_9DEIO|nr:MBL fold metallo-hydrolase [Deinobacterium chartae]MBB6098579.1 beta-lactamase superfamily II metal-dependent hydrolase [Deinobacterium chartae]